MIVLCWTLVDIYSCFKSSLNNYLLHHSRISYISRKCRLCSTSTLSTGRLFSTTYSHHCCVCFITVSDFVS